ncbi:MAG: hypothetical protein AAF721_01300 [Myxococcota bacterium]
MGLVRNPWREFIAGGRGAPPAFLAVLLGTLGAGCLADTFWELRPLVDGLRLSAAVWEHGEFWRLVTYGCVGWGGLSVWSLLQLVLVYWLSMEVIVWLRVKRARIVLLGGVAVSGCAAVVAQIVSDGAGGPVSAMPFWMMQGQQVLVAIALASFATCNRHATIAHTPFVLGLPLPVRWVVPLQMAYATAAFASTRDIGGFVGIAVATVWGTRVGRAR